MAARDLHLRTLKLVKVNLRPSPRAREAIEHCVSGLSRAETSQKMGITERRVSQLTAGQIRARELARDAQHQDAPAPVSEAESAPPEPAPEPPPSRS
jgi:hypothetical protein